MFRLLQRASLLCVAVALSAELLATSRAPGYTRTHQADLKQYPSDG